MHVDLISVIVPCYDESETLPEFYRRVCAVAKSLGRRFEFVFVNDGSRDETAAVLDELAERDRRVKVVHLAQNRGHQIALTAGMDHASGDMVVTIDADLQDPPELIGEMLSRIEEGFDVVHAQRDSRAGETVFKLATARLFYVMMRRMTGGRVIENCGDFRAFSRPVLEVICHFREPHRFMRGLFSEVGFRQCVVTYDRDPRHAGDTKYPLHKMIRFAVDAVFSFSAAPIRLILGLSAALWLLSLLYLAKTLYEKFVLEITVPGWVSLIVLMTFLTGLILFSLAVIGAYVGRIFEQGQRRPLYWVSETRNVEQGSVVRVATDEPRPVRPSGDLPPPQEQRRLG